MKKGNSVIEYSILIIVFVLGILAMQVYIRRGFSGRWRAIADTFGYGRSYEQNVTTVFEW